MSRVRITMTNWDGQRLGEIVTGDWPEHVRLAKEHLLARAPLYEKVYLFSTGIGTSVAKTLDSFMGQMLYQPYPSRRQSRD